MATYCVDKTPAFSTQKISAVDSQNISKQLSRLEEHILKVNRSVQKLISNVEKNQHDYQSRIASSIANLRATDAGLNARAQTVAAQKQPGIKVAGRDAGQANVKTSGQAREHSPDSTLQDKFTRFPGYWPVATGGKRALPPTTLMAQIGRKYSNDQQAQESPSQEKKAVEPGKKKGFFAKLFGKLFSPRRSTVNGKDRQEHRQEHMPEQDLHADSVKRTVQKKPGFWTRLKETLAPTNGKPISGSERSKSGDVDKADSAKSAATAAAEQNVDGQNSDAKKTLPDDSQATTDQVNKQGGEGLSPKVALTNGSPTVSCTEMKRRLGEAILPTMINAGWRPTLLILDDDKVAVDELQNRYRIHPSQDATTFAKSAPAVRWAMADAADRPRHSPQDHTVVTHGLPRVQLPKPVNAKTATRPSSKGPDHSVDVKPETKKDVAV